MRKLLISVLFLTPLWGLFVEPTNGSESITLELIQQIPTASDPVPYRNQWSPHGKYYTTFDFIGIDQLVTINIWMYENYSLKTSIETELGDFDFQDILWSPDEKHLAVVHDSGGIAIFDIEAEPTQQTHFLPIEANILHADWSQSNILSVVLELGREESSILHFDMTFPENPRLIHEQNSLDDFIISILWNPEGDTFVTVSEEENIVIWNTTTFEPLVQLNRESNILDYPVYNMLRWSKDSKSLFGISRSFSEGHQIWEWNLQDELSPPYSDFFSFPDYFQLSGDDSLFILDIFDGDVIIGNVETREFILNLSELLDYREIAAAWHPSENILAVNDGECLSFYRVVETTP